MFLQNSKFEVPHISNHIFPEMNSENVPGVKMLVFKVTSPNEIILKYSDYNLA